MSWWFGAGLGWLRGGPLGAVLGGLAGHFLGKAVRKKVRKRLPGITDENLFVTCIIILLTQLGMTKGHLTAAEVEALYRFFVRNLDYDSKDLEQINRVIQETIQANPRLEPVVGKFLEAGSGRYRNLLLTLAYQQALLGGGLDEPLQNRINDLAHHLGLSLAEHRKIRDQYSLGEMVTPYSILGVGEDATNEEIRRAFRQRLAEVHPDRVMHLGDPHIENAHMKFLEVQSAYRQLAEWRGL